MPQISVIIPAHNEANCLSLLIDEVHNSLKAKFTEFEIIVVSDGSTDDTELVLNQLIERLPELRFSAHKSRQGKTASWLLGARLAKFDIAAFLDGDGQDDPGEIPRLYDYLVTSESDLVSGHRIKRQSTSQRKAMSRFGNSAIQLLTGTTLCDQGCGLKLFRRDVFLECALDREMHRFFPLIAELNGYKVSEIQVNSRNRIAGASNYDWRRIFAFASGLFILAKYISRSSPRAESFRSRLWLLLIFILTSIGALLRLSALGREGLWLDEYFSIVFSRPPIIEIPQLLEQKSVHPPLYFVLLHIWSSYLGWSEAGIRLLSSIFGIAAIPAIAALGKQLLNRTLGALSALILCLSPFHLFHSQNARPYSLLALLVILSFYGYNSLVSSKGTRGKTMYVVSTVFLLYTHVFAACAVITQSIDFLLLKFRKVEPSTIRSFIGSLLVIGIAFAPWLTAFLTQAQHTNLWAWIPPPSIQEVFRIIEVFTASSVPLLLIMLVGIYCSSILFFRKRDAINIRHFGSILLAIVVPIAWSILVSLLYVPTLDPRYFTQSFLFFVLLSAFGASFYVRNFRSIAMLSILFILISILPLFRFFTEPQRQYWREAIHYIESVGGPYDFIYSDYELSPIPYYASEGRRILRYNDLKVDCSSTESFICHRDAKVWLIRHLEAPIDRGEEKLEYLGLTPISDSEHRFPFLKVTLYARK